MCFAFQWWIVFGERLQYVFIMSFMIVSLNYISFLLIITGRRFSSRVQQIFSRFTIYDAPV